MFALEVSNLLSSTTKDSMVNREGGSWNWKCEDIGLEFQKGTAKQTYWGGGATGDQPLLSETDAMWANTVGQFPGTESQLLKSDTQTALYWGKLLKIGAAMRNWQQGLGNNPWKAS